MKIKLILPALAGVLMGVAAHSQNAPRVVELDLQKSLEIALSDNPTIRVADLEIERQTYVRKETSGNLMPQLSGSGSYNYNLMNPVMFLPEGALGPGTGGAMRMGFSNSFVGGLSLAVPLYMPTLYKTLQLNDKQMLSAVESARESKITLAQQVKKSYYSILLAHASLGVIRENIANAEVIVKNAQDALAQGVSSEYDLVTAQVQLSNMSPVLLTAENALKVSELMFNMLLSLPLDTKVVFKDRLETYAPFVQGDTVIHVELEGNAQLRLLDIQHEVLGKQLEVQKAMRIPTLSGVAQYQVQSQNNTLNLGSYDWRGTALAGLQLSVPIFAGLTKVNKEKQIKNSIAQLEFQRSYAEQNVNVEAQTALTNLDKAREQMYANFQARTQARKGYTISKTRFDTGMGTIVELNSAQVASMQAQLNLVQSVYDYMSARADLDKVMGQIM